LGRSALRHPLLHRKRLLLVHEILRIHVPARIPYLLLHKHQLPLLLVHIHSAHIARHLWCEIRARHARVYTRWVVTLITEWVHPALQ